MKNSTHSPRKHSGSHNGPRPAARQAESTVSHLLNSAGQMMEDTYEKASDMAHSSYEHGRDMASEWCDEAGEFVQARPMESVLVAAGVGLLVGFMLGRRH
ncbi:MAG TPA: hypothetical protein VHS31_16630 [Tepidisphaeraceae bacterium]|nr:hypothetical protein [Tepidisphaeraceae bacterium]